MENNLVSMLLLENMNKFHNLIKIVNNERFTKENNLTERQFFALSSIKQHKKIELKNLSRDLHVSTSSLCILLNKLVEKGYVYREEDTRDRRNTFYGITEEGDRVLIQEVQVFIGIINKKVEKLSEEDKRTLFESMTEVKSIINKLFEKI
ncbi:MarR family winged helix-turn-helix transcriptional regulator [Romboutsia sp.]|uniref:MarR family winged helix-turn-helix transcriptional regulator n=1 Tax=Romboutsia sp. TaxID=1965302 RepID=UPI003F352286